MTTTAKDLRALLERATQGPWEAHKGIDADKPSVWDITSRHNHTDFGETPKGWFLATVHEVMSEEGAGHDAALIVTAINYLRDNIDKLEAMEARDAE